MNKPISEQVNNTPYYYQPIKKSNAQTRVVISSYSINQPTKSGNSSKMVGGQMDISLNFTSDDFSPAKYEEFLILLQQLLNEKYQ